MFANLVTGLQQNAGREISALPDLAEDGDIAIFGNLAQTPPQLIDRDVDGSGIDPFANSPGERTSMSDT